MTEAAAILAALARIEADIALVKAALGIARPPTLCPVTEALGQTFSGAFTAREVWEEATRQADRAKARGSAPEGLPRALAGARIDGPHAFGRWAAGAPGLEPSGKENGVTLWHLVKGVDPL